MNDGPTHRSVSECCSIRAFGLFGALRTPLASATRFASSKHRAENTIPKLCRHTVVAIRKPVMVTVMLQQGSRKNCGILMGAIMDKQIPGVSDESAGQNGASSHQIENDEGQPYLPEDPVYRVLRTRMVDPVFYRRDGMQNKAVRDVLNQRPCRQAATKEHGGNGRLESRDDEQRDGNGNREEKLAEVNSDRPCRYRTRCQVPEPPAM